MLDFPYYILYTQIRHENFIVPVFYTCAKTINGYFRIADLQQYLKDGTGLSDDIIEGEFGEIMIKDNGWKSSFGRQLFA